MAVEDAEAPRRQHEQTGARKQDADDRDRQLRASRPRSPGAMSATSSGVASTPSSTSVPVTSASSAATAPATRAACSRSSRATSAAYTGMNDADSAPSPNRFCRKFGNAERRHERVGRIGEAEILGEEPLADKAGQPAAEDAERDERGRAVHVESRI